MSRADDFRNLADSMANAHTDRTGRIANIKKEVRDLLGQYKKGDAARAKEVKTLRNEARDLLGEFKKGDAARAKEVRSLRHDTQTMLAGFKKDSAEAHAAWGDLLGRMASARGVSVMGPKPRKAPTAAVAAEEKPTAKPKARAKRRKHKGASLW